MNSNRRVRVEERAYHIWVAEGRPHGQDEEHWHRAEREIAEEESRQNAAPARARRGAGAAEAAGGGISAGAARSRKPAGMPSEAGEPATKPEANAAKTGGGGGRNATDPMAGDAGLPSSAEPSPAAAARRGRQSSASR